MFYFKKNKKLLQFTFEKMPVVLKLMPVRDNSLTTLPDCLSSKQAARLVLKPPQPPHPHNPHTPTTLADHGGCGVVGV